MSDPIQNLIDSVTNCVAPWLDFPSIDMPGFPNILVALSGSLLAGVSYVLDFLPPDIDNLPSLPSIDIFVTPLTASLAIDIPGGTINGVVLPSVDVPEFDIPDISVPELGIIIPGFDPTAFMKLLASFALIPFEIFVQIVNSIISLSLEIPSISSIGDIILDAFDSVNLSLELPDIGAFINCLATGTRGLLTDQI